MQTLARELLQAVDQASATELLELLTRIIRTSPGDAGSREPIAPNSAGNGSQSTERLELLQSIAMRLRIDLHSMLMQIYQRLEAARSYLGVVRHLAGHPYPPDSLSALAVAARAMQPDLEGQAADKNTLSFSLDGSAKLIPWPKIAPETPRPSVLRDGADSGDGSDGAD